MLDPPVSTPISRMQAIAASRMRWYSLSVRVCAGATVMESPVCTPMGSKFSMEQIDDHVVLAVTHHLQLELLPAGYGLLHEDLGDHACIQPAARHLRESLRVHNHRPAGASQGEGGPDDQGEADVALPSLARLQGNGPGRSSAPPGPTRSMDCLNSLRSSAFRMASLSAPIIRTP